MLAATPGLIRLAHFSDIHVTADHGDWRAGDWFSKRAASWVNHRLLGRAARFRFVEDVLAALRNDLRERQPDHLVFSGDATTMGFEAEVSRAAELLPLTWAGLAVPGNHDYCTHAAMASGAFERHFAPWQVGERIDGEVYPFAQRVGGLWLIGVNSATPNRWAWDARGRVGRAQLARLRRLLASLDDRPRILVTHYPIARACGRPEAKMRRLRDLWDLVHVAREGGVTLWLHGHQHQAYDHGLSGVMPIPSVCAGSATQAELWSYDEHVIDGTRCVATRRAYDPTSGTFVARRGFEVELRKPQPTSSARMS